MIKHRYFAVIPARRGSKGVADKNVKPYRGKPLLVHSLCHADQMATIVGYCLWTDSPDYFSMAKLHGSIGENFGLRSKHCSDLSEDWQFLHDLQDTMSQRGYIVDAFVLLRPTTPERCVGELDKIVELFDRHWEAYDSMRTVSMTDKTPFKMWFGKDNEDGTITGDPLSCRLTTMRNAHSMPRQILPSVFIQNGVMDIIKGDVITKTKSSSGDRVMIVPTKGRMVDIDNERDFL